MKDITREEVLKIPEVVEEVRRHLWIESERAGRDVGYDWAADDWFRKFSKNWLDYHRPNVKLVKKSNGKPKGRAAKSYFF